MFSPQLSPFLFALASIPTYVYRVSLEGSKRSSGGKVYFATSWNSWYRPGSEKCALALPLCGCATGGHPGCPSMKMEISLLAGRINIEISCSLRSPRHKGFNFSPIFIQLIFFFIYLFPSKYKSLCPSAEIRKKRAYSAVAH